MVPKSKLQKHDRNATAVPCDILAERDACSVSDL